MIDGRYRILAPLGQGGSGSLLASLFALPFWFVGFGMVAGFVNALLAHVTLHIDRHTFTLTRQRRGNTADLAAVELQTAYTQNGRPVQTIALLEGINQYKPLALGDFWKTLSLRVGNTRLPAAVEAIGGANTPANTPSLMD